jgi:hypothetical protein
LAVLTEEKDFHTVFGSCVEGMSLIPGTHKTLGCGPFESNQTNLQKPLTELGNDRIYDSLSLDE